MTIIILSFWFFFNIQFPTSLHFLNLFLRLMSHSFLSLFYICPFTRKLLLISIYLLHKATPGGNEAGRANPWSMYVCNIQSVYILDQRSYKVETHGRFAISDRVRESVP